jgi:hypothetical protein
VASLPFTLRSLSKKPAIPQPTKKTTITDRINQRLRTNTSMHLT